MNTSTYAVAGNDFSYVSFGQSNAINANAIDVANMSKQTGLLEFQNLLTNSTLTMRQRTELIASTP